MGVLDSLWIAEPDIYPIAVRRFVTTPGVQSSHAAKVAQVIGSTHANHPGVAPQSELCVAEVIGGTLTRGWASMAEALEWLDAEGCQVINMSFACPTSDTAAEQIMRRLDDRGVILTSSFNAFMHWPHSLPYVIAVGTLHQRGAMDIQVDGDAVVTDHCVVEPFRGTSVASARMAGMAACAKESDPHIRRETLLVAVRGYSSSSSSSTAHGNSRCISTVNNGWAD